MKIIQSFWSKPILAYRPDEKEGRTNGGWPNRSYYLMSWALSCLQALRFYDKVELITDQAGKELLIDRLHLPYTKVSLELDSIDQYSPDLWCLGKVLAYWSQHDPFLHIDSDVFLWKKFPASIENAEIAVQHKEMALPFYQALFKTLSPVLNFMPAPILASYNANYTLDAYNMGIAGGKRFDIFEQFKNAVFEFVNRNLTKLDRIPLGLFNPFLEQVLFLGVTSQANTKVECLIEMNDEDDVIRETQAYNSFVDAEREQKYIHLYGYCKQNEKYCLELEKKLKNAYFPYYKQITELEPHSNATYHYF
jgi:hypothetical protein